MKRIRSLAAAAALALLASTTVATPSFAENERMTETTAVEKGPEGRVRAGVLACEIEGGVGFIVGSSKGVACTFKNNQSGDTETYTGRIDKVGVDIGVTGKQYMRWLVFAPNIGDNMPGLAGTYSGLSAGGGLVAAFGANALIGGSDRSLVLQPVSVQAGTGLNVAAGVAQLRIEQS